MKLSVDFEKAYDSVDLNYLDSVMANMNFLTLWRKLISALVNGSPTNEFPLVRGLRQGDPLSPFLFLIASEGLNVLMNAAKGTQLFIGYGIGHEAEV